MRFSSPGLRCGEGDREALPPHAASWARKARLASSSACEPVPGEEGLGGQRRWCSRLSVSQTTSERGSRRSRGRLVDLGEAEGGPRIWRGGARPSAPSAAKALNSSSRAAGSMRARWAEGQVVRNPGLRGFEAHPGRGGHRDALDAGPGALGHRVERADVLDLVAEEVEAVGLGAVTG
jgi:hypothetical protein